MSEVKVNKISPRTACGTTTLGDSGDTFTIPAGVTITNSGTAAGFGATGAASWDTTVKTTGFTAVSGVGYFVNTTAGAISVNLPAGTAGDVVAIKDYANTFDTNAVTLVRNGSDKIGGVAVDATLGTEGLAVTLVYVDATKGWLVTDSGLQSEAPSPQYVTATGGTITTAPCGDFKIHTFTGPGTFCVSNAGNPAGSGSIETLIVAGGGGGARGCSHGGGGGAGGYRTSAATPVSAQAYSIVIGGGGAGGPAPARAQGTDGVASSAIAITSAGGGGGGGWNNQSGRDGGSGGGSGCSPNPSNFGSGNIPAVSPPQGNPGGEANPSRMGGGGGASCAGQPGGGGGNGGAGTPNSISGSATFYAGGGGAGGSAPAARSSGGNGGGGAGGGPSGPDNPGVAGTANTGGGGGGSFSSQAGGAGGSGIVIIKYKFQN